MRKTLFYISLMTMLSGCFGFGAKKALPDKRSQVPGSVQVNNYLEQVTSPASVHCLNDEGQSQKKQKSYFHDGYAKISTNFVGQDVSHSWDESWNNMIGKTLEDKFPELISEEASFHEGNLIQMGCPGFSVASKEDKKRFWALFLASLARVQSGFDPAFKEGKASGLFALDPDVVGPLGGECEGKDEYDFFEPSYSFGCVFQALKFQQSSGGSYFSEAPNEKTIFKSMSGPARFEFIKFFKAHGTSQFSFCSSGVNAPEELTQSNAEGEKVTEACTTSQKNKIRESLDRSSSEGKGDGTLNTSLPGSEEGDVLKAEQNASDAKASSSTKSK